MALDAKSWTRTAVGYQGTFYMLPDRGYNVAGTTDYRARLNKLTVTFTPLADPAAVSIAERQKSVTATLTDSILLTDPAGESLTGLDPAENGIRRAANGFPDLPQARYVGLRFVRSVRVIRRERLLEGALDVFLQRRHFERRLQDLLGHEAASWCR